MTIHLKRITNTERTWEFKRVNMIHGVNGSGKHRFLKHFLAPIILINGGSQTYTYSALRHAYPFDTVKIEFTEQPPIEIDFVNGISEKELDTLRYNIRSNYQSMLDTFNVNYNVLNDNSFREFCRELLPHYHSESLDREVELALLRFRQVGVGTTISTFDALLNVFVSLHAQSDILVLFNPETKLHITTIERLSDILREYLIKNPEKQMFILTHSPEMYRAFKTDSMDAVMTYNVVGTDTPFAIDTFDIQEISDIYY